MSDPGPPALVWLPLLHRIANVENGGCLLNCFVLCLFKQMNVFSGASCAV